MELRKTCLYLTMRTGTGLDYYGGMGLYDFMNTVKAFTEIQEELAQATHKKGAAR